MKELQNFKEDNIEITKQLQEERKTQLMGSFLLHSGHKLFEYNHITGEIKEAEFAEVNIDFEPAVKGKFAPKKKVIMKENCEYIMALNKKNALKRINKPNDPTRKHYK